MIVTQFPTLDPNVAHVLTHYAVTCTDGLFVQQKAGGDPVDLVALLELHARPAQHAAAPWAARSSGHHCPVRRVMRSRRRTRTNQQGVGT